MITKYQVVLKTGDEFKFSSNMASLMHGAIMDYLDKEYIEKIHEQGIRPFSQSIFKNSESEWIWEVNSLNKEATENIISRLCSQNNIYIKHRDISIDISEYKIKNIDYNQLFKSNYFSENSRIIDIEFNTPTAFKRDNRYLFYPDIGLIFKSLVNRYDACSDITQIGDDAFSEELEQAVKVIGYKLRSTNFYLEGVKIPAFVGSIKIKVNSNPSFVNLIHMLVDFGQYSGVGIKTALGMGKISKGGRP